MEDEDANNASKVDKEVVVVEEDDDGDGDEENGDETKMRREKWCAVKMLSVWAASEYLKRSEHAWPNKHEQRL